MSNYRNYPECFLSIDFDQIAAVSWQQASIIIEVLGPLGWQIRFQAIPVVMFIHLKGSSHPVSVSGGSPFNRSGNYDSEDQRKLNDGRMDKLISDLSEHLGFKLEVPTSIIRTNKSKP